MKKISATLMTLIFVFSIFSIYAPRVKATSLPPVGYWKFDEGSGTVASDNSGNGNTGTLTNGPLWVDGVSGKALKFDGINDYVYVPHSSSLDIAGNEISVEYWIKLAADWYAEPGKDYTYDQILYDKGDAYTAAMIKSTGAHRFNIPYLPQYPETNKNSWEANTWYHIANVFDGTQIRIYINGILDKAESVVGSVSRSTINLAIGSHCFGGKNFFNGVIDEFAIYDYARTQEEIWNDWLLGAGVSLPWRDDFDYATKEEMEAAGWILSEEERISVGGGVVTLDNDGAHGCGVKYLGHFPSGVYDFSVEAKSKWIGRAYGQRVFYVWTQRHLYGWYGDGYYPEYSFIRYSDGWSGEDVKVLRFGGYAPVINEWATFTLEKKGNTFYMYEDGILKNTYTETDSAPDELVAVSISGGWISTVEYDYISVEAGAPVPDKGEPRGVFVRFSQLLGIVDNTPLDPATVKQKIDSFIDDLEKNNITSVYIGFKSDGYTFDPDPLRQWNSGVLMYKSVAYSNRVYSPFVGLTLDPMQYLVETAHNAPRRIEVHAWMPVFKDELGIRELGLSKLDQAIDDFVDPSDPKVWTYFVGVATEIRQRYNIDGLNLDYIRCHPDASVDKEVKAEEIVQFVANIRHTFPGLTLSGDVFSLDVMQVNSGSRRNIKRWGQDWIGISAHVDVLMPMLYHFAWGQANPNWVGTQVSMFWKKAGCPYITPIIQAADNASGWPEGTPEMTHKDFTDAVESAIANRADGFAIFHYCGDESLEKLGGLQEIHNVLKEPTVASWQIEASLKTDQDIYRTIWPTIQFDGSFLWKACGNPLSNSPVTVEIRKPPPIGRWLDFKIQGYTGDDGSFVGQISGLVMWPGEWMLRVKDDTYGAAAITTFLIGQPLGGLLFSVFSLVDDLHVYDPESRHVGLNDTGGIDLEIPGAFYSGPESEPEFILVPNPLTGTYTVILSGTGEGNYTLSVMFAVNETTTIETSISAYIKEGQSQTFSAEVSENSLTLVANADMDFDPDTLNLRSKGKWVTCYIELPGFNVSDIDVSTILLNGTIPVDPSAPIAIEDYDHDTIPDLMVKFNRTKLASHIYHVLGIKYGNVTISISGTLKDGTLFEGSDTIKVIFAGDVNCDGCIDSTDLNIFGAAWSNNPHNLNCDLNGDGVVDSTDYGLLATNYGATVPPQPN